MAEQKHMSYSQKKDIILNALIEREGLQHLVNIAAVVLDNPVFVVDLSGKILCRSQREEDVQTWAELFPDNKLVYKNYLMVEHAGIYERILENDMPVYGQFEFYSKRFVGCRIRDKGDAVGIVTIIENSSIKPEDTELLIIVCKAILFEMLYYERTSMQTTPYFSLFKDLIENTTTAEDIELRCIRLHLDTLKQLYLIAVGYDKLANSMTLHFVRQSVLASLPNCYCIIYKGLLLIVIEEILFSEASLETLQQCFCDLDVWIGVSRSFDDISKLSDAYEQIVAISIVRKKLHLDTQVIFYEDIILYHLFETAAKERNPEIFCTPILGKLQEYDKKNNSYLFQSVEAFLEAGRNIQKAAECLNVHKNTLYYRLKRAEELFDFNLEDENICFLLQLSYRIKRMIQ